MRAARSNGRFAVWASAKAKDITACAKTEDANAHLATTGHVRSNAHGKEKWVSAMMTIAGVWAKRKFPV